MPLTSESIRWVVMAHNTASIRWVVMPLNTANIRWDVCQLTQQILGELLCHLTQQVLGELLCHLTQKILGELLCHLTQQVLGELYNVEWYIFLNFITRTFDIHCNLLQSWSCECGEFTQISTCTSFKITRKNSKCDLVAVPLFLYRY